MPRDPCASPISVPGRVARAIAPEPFRCRPRYSDMSNCRILYFRGGILEATEEVASADLVDAAKAASARHPQMTAEIWRDGRKAVIVRPSWAYTPR